MAARRSVVAEETIEELFQYRVEPYQRTITALEDRQRLYDDQESRMSQLTRALEDQEHKSQELHSELQATSSALEEERESSRRASAERHFLEQQMVGYQKEAALRKTHGESLQKRVALMESELIAKVTFQWKKSSFLNFNTTNIERMQILCQCQHHTQLCVINGWAAWIIDGAAPGVAPGLPESRLK